VLAATLEREPRPLTECDRRIPAELERIVAKALRKDRGKRYQTIRDMLVDLESLKQQLDLESAGFFRRSGKKAALLLSISVLVMVIAIAGAIFFSKSFRPSITPKPAVTPTPVIMPERTLTYYLIARRDPKRFPDSQPFRSTGEHIFEAWYQVRLVISSNQAGYLYVLNEGPPDSASHLPNYVALFPDAETPNWSAAINPNHSALIPQTSDNWNEFDKERGTEKFWLVWSEQSVPELEAVKHLANRQDAGAISNPDQIIPIAQYLARHSATKPEVVKDEEQKLITFKAKGETLVALIRIEHQ
jgi:hypothetical protein